MGPVQNLILSVIPDFVISSAYITRSPNKFLLFLNFPAAIETPRSEPRDFHLCGRSRGDSSTGGGRKKATHITGGDDCMNPNSNSGTGKLIDGGGANHKAGACLARDSGGERGGLRERRITMAPLPYSYMNFCASVHKLNSRVKISVLFSANQANKRTRTMLFSPKH